MSFKDNVLEQNVCDVFEEIGVDICNRDIQACHRLKDKDQIIVKFTNRKDFLRILRVKRQLKGLDLAAVDLPEGTKIFVNESLSPYYRGIWNKCKKLRDKQKVHQYYTINGNVVKQNLLLIWLTYRICSPILKLIVCSSIFFLIFAGEVSVVFYFLESFVIFCCIYANYFCCTFSAILDFSIIRLLYDYDLRQTDWM